jgi:hypothetical protein
MGLCLALLCPSLLEAEWPGLGAAPCERTMFAWSITGSNTFYRPQSDRSDLPASVPFTVSTYYYKGGNLLGEPRFTPKEVTANYVSKKWIWKSPIVWMKCYYVYTNGTLRTMADITDAAGPAILEATADDVDDLDEECYFYQEGEGEPEENACEARQPGPGYVGQEGNGEDEECYEVWYEWYDEEGDIVWEEYAGYDICFRDGLMT